MGRAGLVGAGASVPHLPPPIVNSIATHHHISSQLGGGEGSWSGRQALPLMLARPLDGREGHGTLPGMGHLCGASLRPEGLRGATTLPQDPRSLGRPPPHLAAAPGPWEEELSGARGPSALSRPQPILTVKSPSEFPWNSVAMENTPSLFPSPSAGSAVWEGPIAQPPPHQWSFWLLN